MSNKIKPVFVQGNHACVLGALKAGCRFFAGYPITPSSEIAEILAIELPKIGGRFIQMEDEIAAMGAVIGASLTGMKALTATSGPGFSLKQENIGYAVMTEVPCVIVNVQRGGMSTGLPTQSAQGDVLQSRWGTHGDHEIIVLTPSTIPEIYRLTIRAFNLAEKYRTPVILLLDEIIGHMREVLVEYDDADVERIERVRPDCPPDQYLPFKPDETDIPPMADFGSGYRYHVTGLCHDETGFPTNDPVKIDKMMQRLNRKISRYTDDIVEYQLDGNSDAPVLLMAYGSSARSARQALRIGDERGISMSLFQPLTIWPFPETAFQAAAAGKKKIIVVEANAGQMKREIERLVNRDIQVQLIGSLNGEPIHPEKILLAAGEVG
ncbi:2-oxoacid:acceptor oxidoreductase subunit alpha [bacterium]|nr:2-oxoacid:acceptor oxidoreductase subunit alpha [candidate division CSSED10-310 bacterium]